MLIVESFTSSYELLVWECSLRWMSQLIRGHQGECLVLDKKLDKTLELDYYIHPPMTMSHSRFATRTLTRVNNQLVFTR